MHLNLVQCLDNWAPRRVEIDNSDRSKSENLQQKSRACLEFLRLRMLYALDLEKKSRGIVHLDQLLVSRHRHNTPSNHFIHSLEIECVNTKWRRSKHEREENSSRRFERSKIIYWIIVDWCWEPLMAMAERVTTTTKSESSLKSLWKNRFSRETTTTTTLQLISSDETQNTKYNRKDYPDQLQVIHHFTRQMIFMKIVREFWHKSCVWFARRCARSHCHPITVTLTQCRVCHELSIGF